MAKGQHLTHVANLVLGLIYMFHCDDGFWHPVQCSEGGRQCNGEGLPFLGACLGKGNGTLIVGRMCPLRTRGVLIQGGGGRGGGGGDLVDPPTQAKLPTHQKPRKKRVSGKMKNSIAFGRAPQREADSQLVRQAVSQTVSRASRQADRNTQLGFFQWQTRLKAVGRSDSVRTSNGQTEMQPTTDL